MTDATMQTTSRPRRVGARRAALIYLFVGFMLWLLPVARPDESWAQIPIAVAAFPWSLLAFAFGTGLMETGVTQLYMALGLLVNAHDPGD